MTRTHRRVVVVSLGDELTLGQSLDTNTRWLSERLVAAGIIPVEHLTLPDDRHAIADAIRRSAERADLIVCTGGLGPTADDLTRDALADVTGDPLVEDPDSLEAIRSWFSSRGRAMLPANAVQARRPSRATALPNRHGTAPGILARVPSRDGPVECFCLPGPPSEMAPMFEESVAPRLRPPAGARIITRALHVIGLGESQVADRLGDLMRRDARVLVGTTASRGIVTVRVRHETHEQAGGEDAPDTAVERVESAMRHALAGHILYEGHESPRERLVAELQRRRLTLAVVESCTGGMLGAEITAVPGSSEVFAGGWITYSYDLKARLVGVPVRMLAQEGAVSAPTA
ncbi:MAG TPA: molybdopterin-binding protein, partial [Phycisphaerales bacterium]|nr:molybdopterin-binding protein [Phycisphaerales bacterium]